MFRWITKAFVDKNDPHYKLKVGIWLYIFLLLFEGALRKWVLPFLATPLLVVRDPIAIWCIYVAFKQNVLQRNIYLMVIIPVSTISIYTSILFGHGSLLVALYGVRALLIHFPFLFVIGKVFTRSDVIKVGKVMLLIAIPMTVLIALQFYSPQSAWVNRAVGGSDEGAGFSGIDGFFRPPGTFSFTNGVTLFYSLIGCFVYFFWLNPKLINRLLLIAGTVCLIFSIPLSVSRGLLFTLIIIALFFVTGTARNPKYWSKILVAIFGLIFLFIILSQLSVFQKATEVLAHRFEDANSAEGGASGTQNRYLSEITGVFDKLDQVPFWGFGAGFFTNVGTLITSGKIIAGISEGEISRMVFELGVLLGFTVVLIRFSLVIDLLRKSFQKLSAGDLLPWILFGFAALQGPQANWAQPTSLGFSILINGLVFASLNSEFKRFKGSSKVRH
jgi:hypothetical protein